MNMMGRGSCLASLAILLTWSMGTASCAPTWRDEGPSSLRAGPGPVRSIVYGRNGLELFALAGRPNEVGRWELPEGREQPTLKANRQPGTLAIDLLTNDLVAFDPTRPGHFEIWANDATKYRSFSSPELLWSELGFHPAGPLLAVGKDADDHKSGEVIVLDTRDGSERLHARYPGSSSVLAFAPDAAQLAVGATTLLANGTLDPSTTTVHIYQLKRGVAPTILKLNYNPHLAFSPDGRTLAAWWTDQRMTVELWSIPEGRLLKTLSVKIKAQMSALAFSPDGRWLATTAWDRTAANLPFIPLRNSYGELRIWNLKTGLLTQTETFDHPLDCLAISPLGDQVACGGTDGLIRFIKPKK